MSAQAHLVHESQATWPKVSLAEVAQVINGGTPKSKVKEYWGGDVQWLTPKEMGGAADRHVAVTERKITDAGLAKSSARLVPPNSVILSTRAPIGHLAINDVEMAFNQGCRGIVPAVDLNVYFLYYFLLANRQQLNDLGTGTTFKELSATSLKAFRIPLPPLDEQKRIVAVLDQAFVALDRAQANAKANLADAIELFPNSLAQAFSPKAAWSLYSIAELVEMGVLERPIDGNHGEIHPKKADFVSSGVPFIMASELVNGSVDQENCYFLQREQADSLRKGFAIDGDILLSHKGTIGRVAMLKTELDYVMLTPQVTYYRIVDAKRLDRIFLYYCLKSAAFQKSMTDIAKVGATRAYIGITRQLELKIPLPNIDVQRELVPKFEEVEKISRGLVLAYEEKLRHIAELRQTLLSRAFAGELT